MSERKSKFSSITQTIKFITGIISWVMLVILVLIAAFLLYYFISMRTYAKKGESFKPAVSLYTIVTQSMEPNINPYDVIVDKTVKDPASIKIGDVITFISTASISRGMTITHRVYDIKVENGEYYYYTKGDNNISPDLVPASYTNVLGKVLIRIPQLGRLQAFLSTKAGWLIVVVIPALFVILSDIVKMFRLGTAKKNVDKQLMNEEMQKAQEEKELQETHQKLMERYNIEDEKKEEEPLPPVNEEVKEPEKEIDIIMKPDLPEEHKEKPTELPKIKMEIELPKEAVKEEEVKPRPRNNTRKTTSKKTTSSKKSSSNKSSSSKKKTTSKNTTNKKKE